MKHKFIWFIGALVVVIIGAYCFSFQVAYNEVAVKATFGKADESSVIREPGLNRRWPVPIQSVHKYSTRLQLLEAQLDEVNTRDNFTVIVRSYMTWKIDDPLTFYKKLTDVGKATAIFSDHLSNTDGIIGRYDFDQLVNTDVNKLKLDEIENKALEQISGELAQYGVVVEQVGLRRIVLSEAVTSDVFKRMKDNRESLAEGILAQGTAEANSITSEARSIADRIMSFADSYAGKIRTQGEMEALQYYEAFRKNEDLAVFVRKIDTLKKILAKRATFVIDSNKLTPFEMLNTSPGEEASGNQ